MCSSATVSTAVSSKPVFHRTYVCEHPPPPPRLPPPPTYAIRNPLFLCMTCRCCLRRQRKNTHKTKKRGTELYPRIWGADVKMFTNCRFGMMYWAVGAILYAYTQVVIYGHLSSSMAVSFVGGGGRVCKDSPVRV